MFIHHMHVMDSAYRSHVIHRAYTEAAACQTTRGQITRFVAAPLAKWGIPRQFSREQIAQKIWRVGDGAGIIQPVCLSVCTLSVNEVQAATTYTTKTLVWSLVFHSAKTNSGNCLLFK